VIIRDCYDKLIKENNIKEEEDKDKDLNMKPIVELFF